MAEKRIRGATDQRKFVMVYHDFLESELLNKNEKLIFIAIKRFANNETLKAFPSIGTICKMTGMTRKTVTNSIKHMEQLGVLKKEERSSLEKGQESNLYTLYDYKEIWNVDTSENNVDLLAEKIDLAKKIAELEALGYQVTKKELPSETDQSTDESAQNKQNKNYMYNDTMNNKKSQVESISETYSVDFIKKMIDYDLLIFDKKATKTDLDVIVNIIYDVVNSTKKTIWVNKESRSIKTVVQKYLKLTGDEIEFVINNLHAVEKSGTKIKNHISYIRTQLYNAAEQCYLERMNKGHNNGDF